MGGLTSMGGLTNTDIHAHTTGRRRPIGCLKLQVIFRKSATNHRALLRKMTYKDKASYGSSPHCMFFSWGKGILHSHTYAHTISLSHTHTHAQGATQLDATLRKHSNYDRARLSHVKHTHTHKYTRVTGGKSLGRTSKGQLQLRPGAAVAP